MDSTHKPEKLTESSEDETIDLSAGFVEQAPVTTGGGEAKPIDGKTGLTWRWAAEADMPVLELLNFEAEIEAGRGMFLPEISFPGAIAVCERNGKIIGGVFAEES